MIFFFKDFFFPFRSAKESIRLAASQLKVSRFAIPADSHVRRYRIAENRKCLDCWLYPARLSPGGRGGKLQLSGAEFCPREAAERALVLHNVRAGTTASVPASLSLFLVYFETPREGERGMSKSLGTDVAQ